MATTPPEDAVISTYRVSTITTNGSVGAEVNFAAVFVELPILDTEKPGDGFLFAKMVDDKGTLLVRGVNPRERARRHRAGANGASCFINQTTVVYRYGTQTPNIKIFASGNLHLTGVKNVDDGQRIVDRVVDALRDIPGATRFPDATLKNRDYLVRMINVDFAVEGWGINRGRLYAALQVSRPALMCVYESNTYQALKVHYYFNASKIVQDGYCNCYADQTVQCSGKGKGDVATSCKRVTLSIFGTGKMMIIGASSMEQVDHVYAFVKQMLPEHFKAVRVPLQAKRAKA